MELNSRNIAYITLTLLHTITTVPADLTTIKQEIQAKFDKAVVEEQAKFVRGYGIEDLNDLNSELITDLATHLDERAKEDITFYQSEFYKSHTQVQPEALNTIQNLAMKIFSEAGIPNVTVLHNPEYEFNKIGVYQLYKTQECFISLNVEKLRDNLAVEALLRHECCHIIYQDGLLSALFQSLGWANSQNTRLKVEYTYHPVSRACEIRADVYAILNSSPDQAKAYIEELHNWEECEEATTHPKLSERIAILQEITETLNAIEETK